MSKLQDIQIDITEFTQGIEHMKEQFNRKEYSAITMMMETIAKGAENHAKENRPWQDRTGEARRRLIGYSHWANESQVEAIVAHQVDYGVFLELAHQRNYAILEESIQNAYDVEAQRALQSLIQKLVKK